jgi:hypothetical protein
MLFYCICTDAWLCCAVLRRAVQVPGSKLSSMFDLNHMQHMPQDNQGRVFL